MRVTKEKAAENRERIVAAASRLFREKGFDGVGLDEIMEDVGLTHGGFYRHFGSKDELAAEAVSRGLAVGAARLEAYPSLEDLVAGYLSAAHRDDCGDGCVVAALGGDIARQGPAVRRGLTTYFREQIERLVRRPGKRTGGKRTGGERTGGERTGGERTGGRGAAARQQAIATLSGLVGALMLARAVDDPALSDEILAAARAAYGGVKT
jgi:TetR/AcrR family transcriptional regulator, transcriptional repressor for nem operon